MLANLFRLVYGHKQGEWPITSRSCGSNPTPAIFSYLKRIYKGIIFLSNTNTIFLCPLRKVVLHQIANLGPPGLAGSIPAVGVDFFILELILRDFTCLLYRDIVNLQNIHYFLSVFCFAKSFPVKKNYINFFFCFIKCFSYHKLC